MFQDINSILDIKDIDGDIYAKALCTSGLSYVQNQSKQIEQKRNILIESKEKILFDNYDSFLRHSSISKEIIDDFQTIENSLLNLQQAIPDFKKNCDLFSCETGTISTKWDNISSMLAKYPSMIEFLEIPQLLNNCIRTYYYDDAIKICDFVAKIGTKHPIAAPIFESIINDVIDCKDTMVSQITKELSGNIQLPVCLKMVQYLRDLDKFTEDQLRIHFLNCRNSWFQSELNKELSMHQNHSLNQILLFTELFRINIFDIVIQYQAIFSEIDDSTLFLPIQHEDEKVLENSVQSKIINSWLLIKIEQYLLLLKTNLEVCVSLKSNLNVEQIIENCFYFGLSMKKIGADFRPQLTILFNEFLKQRFIALIEKANARFTSSLSMSLINDEIFAVINQDFNEIQLKDFPILINYQSDLFDSFNEIRHHVPLALVPKFTETLNNSFKTIADELQSYLKKHQFGMSGKEIQIFQRFCHQIRILLPKIDDSFKKLCPLSLISQKLGVSLSEMSKYGLSNSFQLEIKQPILELNDLIKKISPQ
ncbi:6-pyruvoyl tetrahydrobiopterin synthase [Sarcoptes scabiei]|nr:6-pyruvoyl tetrahydrobiopterin synthase [Sarcoptes scabiei]